MRVDDRRRQAQSAIDVEIRSDRAELLEIACRHHHQRTMTQARRDYQPHYGINYLFAVPSVALDRRSAFQGFTPQLFPHTPHFARLVTLPSDSFSASLSRVGRIAFRSAGMASWLGTPAAIPSLLALTTAELVERPFLVVFTIDVAATTGCDFDPVEGHRTNRFSYAGAAIQMEDAMKRIARWLA